MLYQLSTCDQHSHKRLAIKGYWEYFLQRAQPKLFCMWQKVTNIKRVANYVVANKHRTSFFPFCFLLHFSVVIMFFLDSYVCTLTLISIKILEISQRFIIDMKIKEKRQNSQIGNLGFLFIHILVYMLFVHLFVIYSSTCESCVCIS